MSYKGRVIGFSIGFIHSVAWVVQNFLDRENIGFISIIAILSYGSIGWLLGKQFDKVKFYSEKDFLTKVYNRRFVTKVFPKLLSDPYSDEQKIAVIVVDIDDFKKINDSLGHKVGDEVLREISEYFIKNIRKGDIVSRWGGDEFIIITPNVTIENVKEIIERIRKDIERAQFESYSANVSLGVAIYPDQGNSLDELIRVADENMFKEKVKKHKEHSQP